MITIPENYTEFLYWIKERTERFWGIDPKTPGRDFVCETWVYGAKWIGLDDAEIDGIEQRYAIRFTPEHREFLRILHTLDRKEEVTYDDMMEDGSEITTNEFPFFYNWLDDQTIRQALHSPYESIMNDVLSVNRVWLKSWGQRPESETEMRNTFTKWYQKAPKLIPITGHRFLVMDAGLNPEPVLSVWGSDIIFYGSTLKNFLLNELVDHLDISEMVYDEEDKYVYPKLVEEVVPHFAEDRERILKLVVPFWQEMIVYWSSGNIYRRPEQTDFQL